ncbi:MAG TPA: UDP-N-acetylmuramoyl-tripeptide--D-alanyl-D-alanine ligase [Nitrospiraceae bacterium]|nr:UDP-N-acetylmuramoyl-tripeptide--D-alanyl-D-alanine ligase [Nitrospiraceae bacterium]
MAELTVEEIIKATGGRLLAGNGILFSGVSINSKTILKDEIFFALRGQRFDGHDFLDEAFAKGAGAVVNFPPLKPPKGKVVICVDNTLNALQQLSHYKRIMQKVPVIGITGSNGKTTTKEMTAAVLSKRFKVLKNDGNLNNHIGMPLSLLKLTNEAEVIVLEMGMNAKGEIRKLCEIAVPTHGVITNIGFAHLETLKDIETVRDAELEILSGIDAAIVNADDSFLMEGVAPFKGRVITFAVKGNADVKADNIFKTERGSNFTLHFNNGSLRPDRKIKITFGVHGVFNIYNALAASAVGLSLGISLDEIKEAIEGYAGFPMRFEIMRCGGITIINDAYNANPSSMREALGELVNLRGTGGERLIAALGDMFELGAIAGEAHRTLAELLSELGIDVFIAVGQMMDIAALEAKGMEVHRFKDADEARQNISSIIRQGDIILIKGSRAMGMERVMEGIISNSSDPLRQLC